MTQTHITEAMDRIADARSIADLMAAEGDESPGVDPEVIKLRRAAMTVWRLLGEAEAMLEAAPAS